MPANRNALVRYKTIDQCLQNRYRLWTLEDLIEACSEALYEYEGIDKGVSRRTVQADIQFMRSDKLGYNAPIVVQEKKYYTYEDPEYSITNLPLSASDLEKLSDSVAVMKQFAGFSQFKEMDAMVQKLEDQVAARKTQRAPVIDFERNDDLKGLEYLDGLYQAIVNRQALELTYQSFRAREPSTFTFHPYLLKEFRNRWFLLGARGETQPILNLALDRIKGFKPSSQPFISRPDFDPQTYYQHVIGVSVGPEEKAELVVLFIKRNHAPYVLTKPLHHSQKVVSQDHFGVTISIRVVQNFELEKSILAFGEGVQVLEPQRLRRKIRDRLLDAYEHYQNRYDLKSLEGQQKKLHFKGHCTLENIYTLREVRQMQSAIYRHLQQQPANTFAIRQLSDRMPDLFRLIFNRNLIQVLEALSSTELYLCKATFFDKGGEADWLVAWHQDATIQVKNIQAVDGYTRWLSRQGVTSVIPTKELRQQRIAVRLHLDDVDETNGALEVISGSHKKLLNPEEVKIITQYSNPVVCKVPVGGIHVLHPMLLHASRKSKEEKRRRVIHLEFCYATLHPELEWAAYMQVPKLHQSN